METLHLFAGAGGGIIADMILGNIPVAAVEIDEYCRKVLFARQQDGTLPIFPIYDDVRFFDGTKFFGQVDVVSGGFPCQDVSIAGYGAGIFGKKSSLFFELVRIVSEIRPKFVFLENSPLIISRGIDTLAGEMVKMGYCGTWLVLSASALGAPHRRERWFGLFSNPNCKYGQKFSFFESAEKENSGFNELRGKVPNSLYGSSLWGELGLTENFRFGDFREGKNKHDFGFWRNTQPGMGGMADGMASRMDRYKPFDFEFWASDEWRISRIKEDCPFRRKRLMCLGNGEVPACAAVAFLILLEVLQSADLV